MSKPKCAYTVISIFPQNTQTISLFLKYYIIMKKNTIYLLLALAVFWTSCTTKAPNNTNNLPTYPTLSVSAQKTVLFNEYPTTLEGLETVEIRSKIDGYIEEVYIEEGSIVQAGQKLFKIDNNRFVQEVQQRKAAVLALEASLETATIQVTRTQALVDKKIVNSFELTTAKNLERVKKAEHQQALAALSDAQTQLAFTQIVSPISGMVGRLPFKKGSLVSSLSETALTTIANTRQIYAHFSLSQKQLNAFINQYPGGNTAEKLQNMPELTLTLSDGSVYPVRGRIQSLSGVLDPQTGSANFRALFPNTEGVLWNGASATLGIPSTIEQAIRIPKKAVFEIQGRYFVYKIDEQNQAKHTEVTLFSTATEQEYVVLQGLHSGDLIITDGIGTLRNGMAVEPLSTK